MYLTWKAVRFRREQKTLFEEGEYVPLLVKGKAETNVCAFSRNHRKRWAISVTPRFFTRLVEPSQAPLGRDVWGSSSLLLPRGAPSIWKNVLTGKDVKAKEITGRPSGLPLASVLEKFPVALLYAEYELPESGIGD